MGCMSAKHQTPATPILRRRLSLGEIGPGDDVNVDVSEEDRSMLMELTQKQVMEFVRNDATAGRKYSVGSETDQQGANMKSFSSKSVALQGTGFKASRDGIGFACKKGLKPEAPNQDSFFIMKVEDMGFSIYGVFDGHGRKGHDISNFVKDNLPKVLFSQDMLQTDPGTALEKTFDKVQYLIEKATAMKKIDASRSGTTCSVVLHDHKQKQLWVAHVGDSRVVLGKADTAKDGKKLWQALDLTVDHKPDLPEERARIEKAGGVVIFDGGWNYRVYAKGKTDSRGKRYPGLNMSRAMGDLSGFNDAGISAKPDVKKQFVAVQPSEEKETPQNGLPPGGPEGRRPSNASSTSHPSISSHRVDDSDKLLLLCSDGVWEFISSEQAVKFVGKYPREDAESAAEGLAAVAWEQWIREMDGQVVDDITALVIHL